MKSKLRHLFFSPELKLNSLLILFLSSCVLLVYYACLAFEGLLWSLIYVGVCSLVIGLLFVYYRKGFLKELSKISNKTYSFVEKNGLFFVLLSLTTSILFSSLLVFISDVCGGPETDSDGFSVFMFCFFVVVYLFFFLLFFLKRHFVGEDNEIL
jgi:1-acyl-sn-glycerol-3-phosphate acyltransferase